MKIKQLIIFCMSLLARTATSKFSFVFLAIVSTLIVAPNTIKAQNSLDTSFNGGVTESYNSVFSTVVQSDGKILVGGLFTRVNGADRRALERFNPDGTRDISFNPGLRGFDGSVYYIALQSDGKIIVSGSFFAYNEVSVTPNLVRLNTDGSLDTTFNSGGTSANGISLKIVIQPDGKILIGGNFTQYNGVSRNRVARLNADGALDTNFNPGTGANTTVEELALQSDGKIIIGGFFSTFNGVSKNAVARLNADGSIDNSFDTGTGVTLEDLTIAGQVLGIAVQANGKILIGGSFNRVNGLERYGLARLNTDGSVDTGFVRNAFDYTDYITIQTDGKILIGGSLNYPNRHAVVRLNDDGSTDDSFQIQVVNDAVNHLSIQTDSKIIVGGNFTTFGDTQHRNLVRLQANGVLDTLFNIELSTAGSISKILQQPNGKIIAVGNFLFANSERRSNIARFNIDGSVDLTFNPITTPSYQSISTAALQADGKILIGGNFTQTLDGVNTLKRLARLNSDGSLDTTFNNALLPSSSAQVLSIKVQANGKILVGGTSINAGGASRHFNRLNVDGSIDAGFNIGNSTTSINSTVNDIEIQPDGKILISGPPGQYDGSAYHGILRLNADGARDTSFLSETGANGSVRDLTLQSDGKILIIGDFTQFNSVSRNRIARLNANGTLDTSFDVGTGANSIISALVVQPNGKIFIGGFFTSFNNTPSYLLARINTNGSFDNSFTSGFSAGSTFPQVRDILQQFDGKTLIGGTFDSYSGSSRNNLARLFTPEIIGGTQPILFVSNRDGNQEIYRMNADGTNQQRLTDTPENETLAQWSPDGQKIAFSRTISSTQIQIWTMNADGSSKTLVSDAAGVHVLHGWSPNGQKILYGRRESAAVENLWTMNPDGLNKVQITDAGMIDHIAAWSPAGTKIAFGRCTPQFVCDIFVMNADGSAQTNLTPTNPNDDDGARWTPDGRIVFSSQNAAGDYNTYIMNSDGGNRLPLTTAVLPQSYSPDRVSPDGTRVAMTLRGSTANDFEISTINLDGTNLLNLTNNSVFDFFGAWSPDGQKIAFRSRRDAVTSDEIYVMNSDGGGVVRLTFNSASDFVTDWFRPTAPRRAPFDFDGDGKTDVGIFRPSAGEWWINRSSSNITFAVQFGSSTDKITAADYTGDGKADIAFFRPSDGFWYVLRSEDLSFYAFPFGSSGDVPVPGDYDGDGKADAAVFRESNQTWYISLSSGGITFVPFGAPGDKPVVADYDGDGKTDIAITRINGANREWWIRRSSDGQVQAVSFGDANDKAVPGDYTGDGKADIAFWRPSTGFWYILRSEDNSFYAFPFGASGDTPTPGDYDGDGKFDAAVFRPSNSVWYQQRSTQGFTAITFGITGDIPIPSTVVP